jgi:predicted GNAT family acetyltransferase
MAAPVLRGRLLPAAARQGARQLGRGASGTVARVLQSDPVGGCLVAARFELAGMDRQLLGGTFWGVDGGRAALCFAGANLVPLSGSGAAVHRLADALGPRGRTCASLVGRSDRTLELWDRLAPHWGPAREVRGEQPLLVCPDPPACPMDERVMPVGEDRLDDYYPAAVAMFTEEVGVDPTLGDGGRAYRARVAGLLSAGRANARFEGREVVFKAEIGALSSRVALIQGVWVHPDLRGRGLAAPATAAVVLAAQRLDRLPSLYVNAHNDAARATYRRVGFRRAGSFASVLF